MAGKRFTHGKGGDRVEVYALCHQEARRAAYRLLALAAREVWGLEALPTVARLEGGKPVFAARQDMHFSISHSGSLAVCALDGAPVGVDVQTVRAGSPRLLRRVCAPEERSWLAARKDSPQAFTLLWTLKESLCKQTGRGLVGPIAGIRPPLPTGEERVLYRDGLYCSLYREQGWSMAVCGRTPWRGEIRWRNMDQLPQELWGPGDKREDV